MATWGDEPPAPPPGAPEAGKRSKKAAQEILADFWDKFHTKTPGKVTSIFPRGLYRNVVPPDTPRGLRTVHNAAESYEAAAKECREKVKRIVRECDRTNEKFTDPDFDISRTSANCLYGLTSSVWDAGEAAASGGPPDVSSQSVRYSLQTLAQSQVLGAQGGVPVDIGALSRYLGVDAQDGGGDGGGDGDERYFPGAVHRVDWIFEKPRFTMDGYSASDIKQGVLGDCWWLAAVATIAPRRDLMEKVCVARDEECGVYGFVFQRDGEWTSVVVDDNLYLNADDFDWNGDQYDSTGTKASKHRKQNQTGSEALYFAHCDDSNETWLPLLEKAYAKVHGDFRALEGGFPGEAVEDMTGGVTNTVVTNSVFRKERLWKELSQTGGELVFSCAVFQNGPDRTKSGLGLQHAYSILQAREEMSEDGKSSVKLVKIRNPWGVRGADGVGEWNGRWADGSREWTPYWLKKLEHTFGDDGVWWMAFEDLLETFQHLYRTRIFDERWTVVQQWSSANISWVTGFLKNKFEIELKKGGLVVIVLSQLDSRYFIGLEGEYEFELHFVLQAANDQGTPEGGEHICRARPREASENRSISVEIELEAGNYEVLPKVAASRRDGARPVEEVVKDFAEKNPQKLRQVGMQYDLAHAKGGVVDEDDMLEKKKAADKLKKEERKRKEKAQEKRALAEAATAMEKAADAMKLAAEAEATAEEPSGKKGTEKKEEAAAPETKGDDTTLPVRQKADEQKIVKEPTKEGDVKAAPETTTAAPAAELEKKGDAQAEKGVEAQPQAVEDEEDEDDKDGEDEEEANEDEEEGQSPWNAVCVLGLRVYARDPEVTVRLVEAADPTEAAALVVGGQPPGATM